MKLNIITSLVFDSTLDLKYFWIGCVNNLYWLLQRAWLQIGLWPLQIVQHADIRSCIWQCGKCGTLISEVVFGNMESAACWYQKLYLAIRKVWHAVTRSCIWQCGECSMLISDVVFANMEGAAFWCQKLYWTMQWVWHTDIRSYQGCTNPIARRPGLLKSQSRASRFLENFSPGLVQFYKMGKSGMSLFERFLSNICRIN